MITVGDFRIGEAERAAVMEVLESGRISEGKKVKAFESAWASFCGTKYCTATSSGTAALMLGLSALKYQYNIRPEAKVITTPITYIATSNAIVNVGLKPVYVDIDPQTFDITPENILNYLEKAPDPENHAIILPVHLMGFPAKMDKINEIAQRYGLITFEDSAQAHGTVYNGRKTGAWSLLSDFSFYIAHNIQAGEMGAVVTDSLDIYTLTRKLKANGRACECLTCIRNTGRCIGIENYTGDDDFDPRFSHDMIGYNFKTMEFQAALALSQLKKADWIIERRGANVKYLNYHLAEFSDYLQLPTYSTEVSYLAYPIVIKKEIPRKELRHELEKRGVETRPLFGCIPTQQPAYKHLKNIYQNKLPHADYIGKNGFYIGCHQYLEEEDLMYIVSVFKECFDTLLKKTYAKN